MNYVMKLLIEFVLLVCSPTVPSIVNSLPIPTLLHTTHTYSLYIVYIQLETNSGEVMKKMMYM